MVDRPTFGDGGEITIPREFVRGEPPESGSVMRVYLDVSGNVVLRPIAPARPREYSPEELDMFAREDEITPDLEGRLDSLLKREPRLFRR